MGGAKPIRNGKNRFARREALRARLFEQQHGLCHLCDKPMTLQRQPNKSVSSTFATFDHKKPVSEGGTTRRDNLALAHKRCNCARMSRPIEEVRVHV